jgi:transcriptional regulator with XRE-family HTH domain
MQRSVASALMRFRDLLQASLLRRRRINQRYSIRSFARVLGIDHGTLSQLMRGGRRATARTIRRLGPRLGLNVDQIAECCALEHEAAILGALEDPRFQADSRWLAVTLNIALDDVNIALHRLLYKRVIVMSGHRSWQRVFDN